MGQPLRIAVLDDYQNVAAGLADWASLRDAEVTFFHDHTDAAALIARLQPFDAVMLMRERTRFDAGVIAALPNLKLILSVGMWNAAIDLPAAQARGIVVSGTKGSGPQPTAVLTWGLVLSLVRNIHAEAASVRAGGWQLGLGADLTGKTLGLLGLGQIGQVVAGYGRAFGMEVIAWSQNLTAEKAAESGVTRVEKRALFARSDFLSIHLKLSERTAGLVGAGELDGMKPTAFLVNTSRGSIVSEPALIDALTHRRIAGAALDVFETEPLPAAHPFRYLPNLLATPHIGYVSESLYKTAFPQTVENIKAWQAGMPVRVLLPA
ncbi:D-2-hydroxyacid dehydrogenase family protein [Ferrovibrio sp.]|uniref:D-2-hydroxyacid dehydrogenase family protein n=1 Tax=Ferrovibrio sp. TaxID=1917215 RepID=UPI000CA7A395|nr:D-2-hydroxyacid dehydrogenase family protein [Ferrovibrio sp.]PJI38766.1 MAG: hydroxyacid dehydrogenase [Ferrovibrio sp.]